MALGVPCLFFTVLVVNIGLFFSGYIHLLSGSVEQNFYEKNKGYLLKSPCLKVKIVFDKKYTIPLINFVIQTVLQYRTF